MPVKFVKPMLAADISEDLDKLRYPVYATPKLDGVRAMVYPDGVFSRNGKAIPNRGVQRDFTLPEFEGLDGELIVGSATAPDVYRKTQSVTSREADDTPVKFYVFDIYTHAGVYERRKKDLIKSVDFSIAEEFYPVRIYEVPTYYCCDLAALFAVETKMLEQGYEGLILRSPDGLYKPGRSPAKAQGMLKLKRFTDSEAEVIGIEEEMHNGNEARKDVYGRTERSSHKANLSGTGRMGALVVRDLATGVEFKIGTGFDAADRDKSWAIGTIVKYKHFAIGAKDKPRFPTYIGLREDFDL